MKLIFVEEKDRYKSDAFIIVVFNIQAIDSKLMKNGEKKAKFQIGEIIYHKRFDYRGVVVDVDPSFSGTEEWYNKMARSNPPKHEPWYHVLVHQAEHSTYVAEKNLETDLTGKPIAHPFLSQFFSELRSGVYVSLHVSH